MDTNFDSRQLLVNGIPIHLVEVGDKSKQPILFLHGYPENWKEFESVMNLLKDNYYLLAIDLPGIGKSGYVEKFDKLSIANFIKDFIQTLRLKNVVLAGHDVGGMITYASAKNFPELISKAVIMCTAIPGVEPWEEVKRNPYIWHFAFYAVPELPENLIRDKHQMLFDYFYDTISFNKSAITAENRQAYVESYNSEEALKTGLGWYRSFVQDEKDNSLGNRVEIPVLYLKGLKDFGDVDAYIEGFKKSGLVNIRGQSVPNSGHFAPEENSQFVAESIEQFVSTK